MRVISVLIFLMIPFLLIGQSTSYFCKMGERTDSVTVFTMVDEMPEYNGAYRTAYEDQENNLDLSLLPVPDKEKVKSYVSFIVDPTGKITEACVYELPSYEGVLSVYDSTAVEFVKTLEYKPGMHRGEARHVIMTTEIVFDAKAIKKSKKGKKK